MGLAAEMGVGWVASPRSYMRSTAFNVHPSSGTPLSRSLSGKLPVIQQNNSGLSLLLHKISIIYGEILAPQHGCPASAGRKTDSTIMP
jgi:hypothetical protein